MRAGRVLLVPSQTDGPEGVWDESDPEVRRYREKAAHSLFRETRDRRKRQFFNVVKRNGSLLGQVELVDIRRGEGVAELRICLFARGARGRGYGEEAIRALLEHARSSLSLRHVYLRVDARNLRAVACYRKCGFKMLGRLDRRDGDDRVTILLMDFDLGSLHDKARVMVQPRVGLAKAYPDP